MGMSHSPKSITLFVVIKHDFNDSMIQSRFYLLLSIANSGDSTVVPQQIQEDVVQIDGIQPSYNGCQVNTNTEQYKSLWDDIDKTTNKSISNCMKSSS